MHLPEDTLRLPSSSAAMLEALFIASPLVAIPSAEKVASIAVPSYREADLQRGKRLGVGGCAQVHVVTFNGASAPLALKHFIKAGLSQSVIANEVWTQNVVKHPNILPVIGVAQNGEGRVVGILTPLAKGGCLSDLVERSKEIPMRVTLAIMRTLLDAVIALHEKHVIHGDLKLDNVLIDDGEIAAKDLSNLTSEELERLTKSIRIADFDIAGLADESGQFVTSYRPHGGTAGHKAPELALRLRMRSFKSDIYALGVLWHGLLTGDVLPYPPALYSNGGAKVDQHVALGAQPECRVSVRFPQKESQTLRELVIIRALYSMWSTNPMKRPDAKELVTILDGCEQQASLNIRAKL